MHQLRGLSCENRYKVCLLTVKHLESKMQNYIETAKDCVGYATLKDFQVAAVISSGNVSV